MVIKHRIKGYKGEEIFSVDGWSINEEDIT
jgi:hypothetical protein